MEKSGALRKKDVAAKTCGTGKELRLAVVCYRLYGQLQDKYVRTLIKVDRAVKDLDGWTILFYCPNLYIRITNAYIMHTIKVNRLSDALLSSIVA